MSGKEFFVRTSRKTVVTGHYGSGKTEFALSLAMLLSATINDKIAIVDLDIVNPYFRSRERRDLLAERGIAVFGSVFSTEVTAEIPALGADVRAPLENSEYRVIVDAGGNESGALVLNQFYKYLADDETTVLAIVNANRPETRDIDGAAAHIAAIETATGLAVRYIVNNSHLVRETTAETIIKGHSLCERLCEATGKELWCDCYPEAIVSPDELSGITGNLMPLGLYMRPTWLDR